MTNPDYTKTNPSVKPLISVVLPVYNGGDYLRQSIESVLNQSLQEFEFLILDDCSTDSSWNYLCSLQDNRIKSFRNSTNKGLFYNLNYLIGQTSSQLIKLWSQDDVMYPNCLETFVRFHQKHPEVGFSYSERDYIDENGRMKDRNFIDLTPTIVSSDLHARIAFHTGSITGNIANVCIPKSSFERVGLFNQNMKISADFEMWVRLAKHFPIGFISDRLIQLRVHEGQLSRQENLYVHHIQEDLQVYRYLNAYVDPVTKKEGKKLMREFKLPFYYTLMVKSFLKGRIKTAFVFFKELSRYDNFVLLTLSFIKVKMKKPESPFLCTQP